MKKILLLVLLLPLSACAQEVTKTPKDWCLDAVKESFAFDFEGENGIFFIREADGYIIQENVEPTALTYVYLVDVVHEGAPDMAIAEYVSWVEFEENTNFENATGKQRWSYEEIIDLGAELIYRDSRTTDLGQPL